MPNIPQIQIGGTTYKVKDADFRNNAILASSSQPSQEENRIWVNEAASEEYEVPTYDEHNDVKNTVKDYASIIGSEHEHYTAVKNKTGWNNTALFFTGRAVKKQVYYWFAIDLPVAPAVSTYFFIYDRSTNTELLNRQLNGLSHLDVQWKPTNNYSNIECLISSGDFLGVAHLTLTSSETDRITDNELVIKSVIDSVNSSCFSLLGKVPFINGGNYYTSYDYAPALISTKTPIVATGNWSIKIDPDYRASFTLINSDDSTTYIDWTTGGYYIAKGQKFVVRIRKEPFDSSEIADIYEVANKLLVYDADKFDWKYANDFCDSMETGKIIASDGSISTAGSYWRTYAFIKPKFKRIMARVSNTGNNVAEIAFYNTLPASASTFDASHSVIPGRSYYTAIQTHYVCADIPDNCEAVYITTRNLLNDDTPFSPEIYVDDLLPFEVQAESQRAFGAQLGSDFKYVCHIFADKVGSGNYFIPCQSMAYIDIAHRLGYKMIELNVHQTATQGKYVCIHGISGTIGDELVAKNGTDISALRFENVSYETFKNDYVYNTSDERFRTHVTFLDEALLLCKKYNIIPLVSWAGYDLVDYVRKYVGDNFMFLVYDDFYLQRRLFKGTFQRYTRSATTLSDIDALCKKVGAPFVLAIDDEKARDYSKDELREIIDLIHSNGCKTGCAGVYQSFSTNMKMSDLGVDFDATGYSVEYFDNGNLVNLHANNTFNDFYTNGQVSNNVLALSNGQYLSSELTDTKFLSKSILQVRFNGTIKLTMGEYIDEETITSDGTNDIEVSTLFVNDVPNFTIEAVGNVSVIDCNYKASNC